MRILQICHRVPYPPIDGGNIAMMNMAQALIEGGHEVHQFALNTSKHFVDVNTIPTSLKNELHFNSIPINTDLKITGAIQNFFSNESYNIIRFHIPQAERELENILRTTIFDIVQLETLFTAPYISCIKKNSNARIVLRAHNVEHIIWERLAKSEKNVLRKYYLNLLARRLKKFEENTLLQIDALVPITSADETAFRKFGFNMSILTVPVSIDMNEYHFDEHEKTEMCLFHLGSMDWMPNLEAIDWFLKKCWPKIHSLLPDLKLYLAGRNMPQEIFSANHPNVICEGRIEDAHAYMKKKQIMIVPLHSGSGIRVKIVQGMALGKTIITTKIGAEGIPAEDGKNIVYADSPDDFISSIEEFVHNTELSKQIGMNARKFAQENYSNSEVGKKLGIFYESLKRK